MGPLWSSAPCPLQLSSSTLILNGSGQSHLAHTLYRAHPDSKHISQLLPLDLQV